MNKNTREKLEMMTETGVKFFEQYPPSFRVGTEVTKITEERFLTMEELATIPDSYHPSKPVIRSKIIRNYPIKIEEKYRVGSGNSQPGDL